MKVNTLCKYAVTSSVAPIFRRQSKWIRCCVVVVLFSSSCLYAEQVAGYRLDGSGVYPGVKPPVKFTYPADVRWEVPLPSWGHGSPIVVGDLVLVVIEPTLDCIWPQLVCLDIKTGKERWRQAMSAAEAMFPNDADQRKGVEAAWQKHRDFLTKLYRWDYRYITAADKAAVTVAMEKDGFALGKFGNRNGTLGPKGGRTAPEFVEIWKGLNKYNLTRDDWNEGKFGFNGLSCVGQTYPTPVSDGQRVYVATAQDVFAAFDLTGKRLWLTRVPGNSHNSDYCYKGRSPILYKGLLISDLSNKVRAFESATGKLLWSDDGPVNADSKDGPHTIVTPMVLTVAGKDVLFAAGCNAYLLPEGKRVAVEGWANYGMQTLVKHDERDVVFFCGAGEHSGWEAKGSCATPPPAAVRFALSGDKLVAKVLWSGIDGKPWGGNRPWMLYDGGKLYCPGQGALDALTGKTVFGDFAKQNINSFATVPLTEHLLQKANGHLYGLGRGRGGKEKPGGATMQVCTLEGKGVAEISFPQPVENPDNMENLAATGWLPLSSDKDKFAYGFTFIFGSDCIILRGMFRLYCIGKIDK